MKCPKCNGDRVVTCLTTVEEFYPDSELLMASGEDEIDAIQNEVSVGVHHCLDCGHGEFWLEDPRSPLEAEVERLREACTAIHAHVMDNTPGMIPLSDCLWLLGIVNAALEPQP